MTTCESTRRRSDRRRRWIAAALAATLPLGATPAAADWPVARGDDASSGAAATSLPERPDLLWERRFDDVGFDAAPVVAGGVVFVGDSDGVLHAVRLADGQPVWDRQPGEAGYLATPAVDGRALYAADSLGAVRRLDAATGERAWEHGVGAEVYGGPLVWRGGERPVLLVPTEAGELYALDAESGDEVWKFTIDQPLRTTPTIVGDRSLVAGCDGKLHVIDLASGVEIGSADIGGPTGCTAASGGGAAYLGNEQGVFFAMGLGRDLPPERLWERRDARRGQGIRSAAAIAEDAVVYGTQAKSLVCLGRATGDVRWTHTERGRFESSPVVLLGGAEPTVVAATTAGRVLHLRLANGELLWDYDAGGSFTAGPAAADGRVVLANTDGGLFCFGPGEGGDRGP